MAYFVTGGTGFIGRTLVERLLDREGDIYLLHRPGSAEKVEALVVRWTAERAQNGSDVRGRSKLIAGDLTSPRLGMAYKVFPDSAAARKGAVKDGEKAPEEKASTEAVALAHLMRGVHW
jgi:nucleoside-diphosphate-sugar epimerase